MAGPDPSRHLYTEQPPHAGGSGDGQRPMGAPPTRAATAPNTVSSASAEASSWRSRVRSACSVSAWELTETYSPAAIDIEPATSPATAATPTIKLAVEMSPSLEPRKAARSHLRFYAESSALSATVQICLSGSSARSSGSNLS